MNGTGDGGGDPRRYLIATAVSHYPNAPAELEWDRPGLAEARRKVVELFTDELGYKHVSELGANPTQHQLLKELRDFCISPDRRPDDVVAVYLAGHGDVLPNGDYVLLTADTSPDDLYDALLPATLARKILAGTKVRRLLLMLDTCFSGQGGNELLATMARLKSDWREEGTGLAVVTSAQPRELALTGAFPELLAEAVTSLATAGYAPPLLALDAVVNATRANPKRPDYQHIGLEIIGLTGETPPFLPNAKHSPRLSHTDLALQQAAEWNEQDRRRDEAFRAQLLRRAMGHRDRDRVGWWFSGRHQALEDITEWLRELPEDRPALVVTGDPGSGKTAVLGLLAAVSDPEYRRTVPLSSLGLASDRLPRRRAIRAALYAQNLTDQQVVRALAAALRLPPAEGVAELLNHLTARPVPDRPRAVLIDGLDEAVTPESLCGQVLRPLMDLGRPYLRLLLGTRPHLFGPLGLRRSQHVDLDAPRYADPEAVLAYTLRNLLDAQPDSPYLWCDGDHRLAVARAVAEAAGHSFLVARITAGTLAAASALPDPLDAGWRRSLPSAAADAMHRDLHQRFGDRAGTILDLLRPLAYAEGQGLPWEDIWAPLASELSGHRYTNQDLHRLRRDAGAYVVEAAEDGRSVYRLYHEAMAEYLRQDQDARAAHRAFTTALRRTVPYRLDGRRDWARAHPYLRRHLAGHAARGGVLDDLVADTEYLAHADCDTLVTHLEEVESDTARLHAAVYRASIDVHRPLDADARRRILALDAARYNEPSLVEALNSSAPGAGWHPVAATGSLLTGNMRNALTGHKGSVTAVACTVLNGRTVAVTGSYDHTVRVWDLTTGQPVGGPLTGHTAPVEAVACTVLNHRTVAVTGSQDHTVRIWDLTTGQPVGGPLTGHTDTVDAVACTELDGRAVAVTGSQDHTVRIWDLASGVPVGSHMAASGRRTALAVALLDGRPVAVTSSAGRELSVWDLATQNRMGRLQGNGDVWITAMACTELDDRAVAVGCTYNGELHVWDLRSRRELMATACEGGADHVDTVVCSELEGRPVLLTCSLNEPVKVLDLRNGRQVGSLEGSGSTTTSLACTLLAGRPIAVGGSRDAVRVWDLSVRRSLGRPVTGHTQGISAMDLAVVDARQVFVTGSYDRTVRVWDAHTCLPVGEPMTAHGRSVFSVACSVLKGRPVVLTSASQDTTVRVWDMETRQEAGPRLKGPTRAVSQMTSAFLHGRPLVIGYALDNTVWVWDLETGRSLHPPLRVDEPKVVETAAAVLDGRPVAVTSGEERTHVWDLSTRRPIARIDVGARAVACGRLGDRPVTVACARDSTVRVWDLATGQPLGRPMTGHSRPPSSVRCAVLDGRSVALTSSADHTVRVWDLATGATVSVVHVPRPFDALLIETNGLLVCNLGSDVAVLRRARPDALG
ncbi:caspase family protein [Streptomyces spiralis]